MKKFNTPNHGNEDDQIKNYEMKVHKLWASENRILLIEHDKHDPDPENLSVSSKWFHVCVRTGKPSTHVATVSEDDEVWAEDIKQMTATVQESIAEIKANNVPIDFSN